jgi:hypothetical protein
VRFRVLWSAVLLLLGVPGRATDPLCPAYPASQRNEWETALARERRGRIAGRERVFTELRHTQPEREAAAEIPRASYVDDLVFGRMERDGVAPAPLTGDAEFLRRVTLDLTGRIPTPAAVRAFVTDTRFDKRARLVEELLASDAHVAAFTLYWGNRFQVTSRYYDLVGITGRNLFNELLRDFVRRDRPLDDLARELITASGDSHRVGAVNFIVRQNQQGDPQQDTWDTLTNTVTTQFLGVQTQCVSCHDGARHLEPINLHLARRKRVEMWQLSAFFSRLKTSELNVDAYGRQRKLVVSDAASGSYNGVVDSNNPGPRPARIGVYEPAYFFGGEKPVSGAWRSELARMVTRDRQFARAAVNYLWAYFFRAGIVDPPDAWDMDRIDPRKPPPPGPLATLQPSDPRLLEALADDFIAGGYRLRPMIRRLVGSSAYQLSVRYDGEFRPEYARYFAKQTPRRLAPEELYDAINDATGTEVPMNVNGSPAPLLRAVELPDPYEPQDGNIKQLLEAFGRGDWWRTPRSLETSVIRVLTLMNDARVVNRSFGSSRGFVATRVARLASSGRPQAELVEEVFLATLGRFPTAYESETALAHRAGRGLEEWLSDLQWALLNRVDFIFNM